jgi:hypothetical protein
MKRHLCVYYLRSNHVVVSIDGDLDFWVHRGYHFLYLSGGVRYHALNYSAGVATRSELYLQLTRSFFCVLFIVSPLCLIGLFLLASASCLAPYRAFRSAAPLSTTYYHPSAWTLFGF